ncbi:hypothetical protein AAZV13_06G240900 [Glycine max]
MVDWGPMVIAVVLFVLLSPGLLFQLPGKSKVVEFGNMQTRAVSILVHTIIFFGLITIFLVAIGAKCLETGEPVAIKKVLLDKRYKNRELQLMHLMDHPNVISLKHRFFSTTSADELFLNLVMEYVPESMYRVSKFYSNTNQSMPLIYVKLYMHQIFRGLAYIHTVPGGCHKDLKPQNILVDPLTHQVKICDFGSAKVLVKGEANISHICSLFYRAPELMFGATEYTTSIDIWSAGCVLAELLLGQPLLPGENALDQLVEIIKVTQMKQEHDKRQASLIAEHNEQLKRTQLQAENELREVPHTYVCQSQNFYRNLFTCSYLNCM